MHLKNISYEEMKTISKDTRKCSTKMILDSFINSDKYAMQIILDDEEGKEAIKSYLEEKDGRTMESYLRNILVTFQHYIWSHKDEYGGKVKVCRKNGKIYLVRVDRTLTVGGQVQRRGYK